VNRELDTLLRGCIECALCLPHCATYLATGDETQSPRGRLMLLREVLDHPDDIDQSLHAAFDLCLGCRACETACPSGVPYALLDAAKSLADEALGPPDGPVIRQLSSRPALRSLRIAGGLARSSLTGLMGPNWRSRLAAGMISGPARQLGTLPASPGNRGLIEILDAASGLATARDAAPGRLPAGDRAVAFFTGCANRELLPRTQGRLLSLLEAAGVAVTVPEGQECCGALAAHTAAPQVARAQQARNVTALGRAVAETGVLVTEAAGCGLEFGTYPEDMAAAVVDATTFLAELPLPPLREVSLRVAYHDPCHARHGQGIVDAPRVLLKRIPGVEVLEPDEADVCCGSGGAYSLVHPELSAAMGRRKAGFLAATGADVVVTSNPGCLGQIADALARDESRTVVLPLTDLLWYATLA
jgi:glycolate oxidase iron-sulfur subunit